MVFLCLSLVKAFAETRDRHSRFLFFHIMVFLEQGYGSSVSAAMMITIS